MANKTTLNTPASAPCACPPWDITSLDELCPVCLQEWRIWWALCELDDIAAHRAAAAAAAAGAPSGAAPVCFWFRSGAWAYRLRGIWFDVFQSRVYTPPSRWFRGESRGTWRARGRCLDRIYPPA
jgi:hypothetical protein